MATHDDDDDDDDDGDDDSDVFIHFSVPRLSIQPSRDQEDTCMENWRCIKHTPQKVFQN